MIHSRHASQIANWCSQQKGVLGCKKLLNLTQASKCVAPNICTRIVVAHISCAFSFEARQVAAEPKDFHCWPGGIEFQQKSGTGVVIGSKQEACSGACNGHALPHFCGCQQEFCKCKAGAELLFPPTAASRHQCQIQQLSQHWCVCLWIQKLGSNTV